MKTPKEDRPYEDIHTRQLLRTKAKISKKAKHAIETITEQKAFVRKYQQQVILINEELLKRQQEKA